LQPLRAGIGAAFYGGLGIDETEIFVSDGAKCDITRLQVRAAHCFKLIAGKLVGLIISYL